MDAVRALEQARLLAWQVDDHLGSQRGDASRVEEHQVRGVPRTQPAAAADAVARRGHRGEKAHRFFEPQGAQLGDPAAVQIRRETVVAQGVNVGARIRERDDTGVDQQVGGEDEEEMVGDLPIKPVAIGPQSLQREVALQAEGKEQVLRSLGEAATRLRKELGESLSSIQKFAAPLDQATTSSLEALKAYSLAHEQNLRGNYAESNSLLKRATELDPNFASAYGDMAINYSANREYGLAAEAARKAFELRERVSEREKLYIAYAYYTRATGEIDKAIEAMELCKQTYPRDEDCYANQAFRHNLIGQSDKAVEEYREAIRLNPGAGLTRSLLASALLRLNRFEEAKEMHGQAAALKFDDSGLHRDLYSIALIQGDPAAMQQQVDWGSARPGEYNHLIWQAGAAVFAGQLQKSRDFSSRAAELARQRQLIESAAEIVSMNPERSAVLGQCQQSRDDLARAAASPRTALSYFRAGFALALCGDAAQALTDEMVKRYPKDTLVNEVYLPLIRAAMELQRGNRTQAIQMLQAVSRYESVSFYYQNYLRGQAYLGERNGAEASREFQTILDHRGWSPLSPSIRSRT